MGMTDILKGIVSGMYTFPSVPALQAFAKTIYMIKIYVYIGFKNSTIEMALGNPNKIYIFD